MNGLRRALKRKDEQPAVEMLDVDALKSRIGEPLPICLRPREIDRNGDYVKARHIFNKRYGVPVVDDAALCKNSNKVLIEFFKRDFRLFVFG